MSKKKPKKKKTQRLNTSPPNAKGLKEKIDKTKKPSSWLIPIGEVHYDLTAKQSRFCHEYVKDFNALQSAIRAGYSKNGAGVQGHLLLKNPKVQELCTALIQKQLEKSEVTDDYIIGTTRELVDSSVQRQCSPISIMGDNGELEASHVEIPIDPSAALKGLHLLANIKGLLKDNSQASGEHTMDRSPSEHSANMKEAVIEKYGKKK